MNPTDYQGTTIEHLAWRRHGNNLTTILITIVSRDVFGKSVLNLNPHLQLLFHNVFPCIPWNTYTFGTHTAPGDCIDYRYDNLNNICLRIITNSHHSFV